MKIFANKFLIIGTLVLLLISIPLTLFLIKRQQDVRSRAEATSRLYFQPANTTTSTQCQSFTMDIMIDPGSNLVSIVDFYFTYDQTKLDVVGIQENAAAFPAVNRPSSISNGSADMSVAIGSDITKSISTITKVATVTFKSKLEGQAQVAFDTQKSRVFSLNVDQDLPTENVLFSTTPGTITTNATACGGTTTPTPTVTPTATPSTALTPTRAPTATPTGTVGGGITPTTTPVSSASPTLAANQIPNCTSLQASPSTKGAAPFAVSFSAAGTDPDTSGLITKADFNFGDGSTQSVTEGMNLKSVSAQTSHTYTKIGTFIATATLTDDKGGISQMCNQTIEVTGSTGGGSAPLTSAAPEKPTAVPTIPASGGILPTIGVIGAVTLTIIVGFVLLAL